MKDHIPGKYGSDEAALARIRELETQLGMPLTQAVDDICQAWDRIAALEDVVAARGTVIPGKTTTAANRPATAMPAASKPLFGLQRAIAANRK